MAQPETGNRGNWGSRLGFILAAAGSAVGLGNLWKFPYITFENHGGAFVLVYLVAILLVGLPIMVSELLLGRMTGRNPVGAFRAVERPTECPIHYHRAEDGRGVFPWKVVGWMGLAAGFIILSYYSVVAGWTLGYATKAIRGDFAGIQQEAEIAVKADLSSPEKCAELTDKFGDPADPAIFKKMVDNRTGEKMGGVFGAFVGNPLAQLGWHLLFMLLTVSIVISGISQGIEKWSKILMPVLFVLLLILMAVSISTGGLGRTLKFLFTWDFASLTPHAMLEALGHAFFTLSLGMGAILTYGSYLNKKTNLLHAALIITVLDTLIAFMACLMLYPIIFHFQLQPTESIGILFTTLPIIFNQLPMGQMFSVLFFLLLAFAALTSAISLLEVVVAYAVDELKISRRRSSVIVGTVIFLFGVPSALCNGASGWVSRLVIFTNHGKALNWLDSFDYLASNWLLPLGGMLIAICVGRALDQKCLQDELPEAGAGTISLLRFLLRWVSPVLVGVVLLNKIGVISL